ncbi:MAG: hypothetical protein PF518_05270 [Spirochaetaceae bacterium]|nr:hypothetical protein [Spirochaetaceae bacterium]
MDFNLDLQLIEDLRYASKKVSDSFLSVQEPFTFAVPAWFTAKLVTTHWKLTDRLQSDFPRSKIRKEKILIDGGYYMSAAGLTIFQDLILYVIKNTTERVPPEIRPVSSL